MSLSDSLLLEGYRDPREVWIAIRTDGVKGSGTIDDPFDGSRKDTPSFAISSLSRGGADNRTATAVSSNHPFAIGDMVTITGVGTGAGPNDLYYTGTFPITSVNGNSFTYQMLAAPDSSPAPGTITCVREQEQFDAIMRLMPTNATVHLGPGIFETKGFSSATAGEWKARSGQRILGAGMGLTTLKIIGGAVGNLLYGAIGTGNSAADYLDGFEASDFTVDCNVDGQPVANVACGAILFQGGGRHVRIRRVRTINFGSKTDLGYYVEDFVIAANGSDWDLLTQGIDGHDLVLEDCIGEWPAPDNVHNSYMYGIGSGERTGGDGLMSWHRGYVIRNCLFDGRNVYGAIVQIDTITYDSGSGIATITTKSPHLHAVSANLIVRGAALVSNGSLNNPYNGIFVIEEIVSATQLRYKPGAAPAGNVNAQRGTIGGAVSSNSVAIDKIEVVDAPTKRYRLTTKDPHFRTTNNTIRVLGVLRKIDDLPSTAFNGMFTMAAYDPTKPNEFHYILLQDPDVDPSELKYDQAFVKMGHIGLGGNNGRAAIVEGNRIYHCWIGGPYQDTWSTRDLIVRNNSYHDVVIGLMQNYGLSNRVSFWIDGIPLAMTDPHPLTHQGDIATAKTDKPHGFIAGVDEVTILLDTSQDPSPYNGTFLVLEVPDARTFTYRMNGTPDGDGSQARYRFATGGTALRPLESLTSAFDTVAQKWVATAVVTSLLGSQRHGLEKNDIVRIGGAGHAQFPKSFFYNGNIKVIEVPDQKTFKYYLPGNPGVGSDSEPADAANFCTGYYGRIWDIGDLQIENNTIELSIQNLVTDLGRSIGVYIYVGGNLPQFTCRQLLVRDNVIRHVNNGSDPSLRPRGIEILTTEHALLQRNIVRLDREFPIEIRNTNTQSFDNNSPDGKLIKPIDVPFKTTPEVVTTVQAELEEELEEAVLLSFL